MRAHSYRSREDETKIDMTPMLDIVFIMLIFFIVTASFLKESGIPITIPEGKAQVVQDKVSIVIEISAKNDVWFGKRRIDPRAVGANVKRRMSELAGDTSVIVRTHPDAKTDTLMQVVDRIRNAGVIDFAVAPIKEN